MTDEEKLAAVEEVLEHSALISEARAALSEVISMAYSEFVGGLAMRISEWRPRAYYKKRLTDALGEARANEIEWQEIAKFCNDLETLGVAPEIPHTYFYGTEEERRSFPRYQHNYWNLDDDAEYDERHSKAVAEWVEDRKHLNMRKEYARKFYGAK
jgi:hypothetical protein